MRLSRALEDKKLDLRLRDKLLHEGKLSKPDINRYLEELPDDAANATMAPSVEDPRPVTSLLHNKTGEENLS